MGPKPPSDLTPRGRGRRFWRAVVDEYDPGAGELELLRQACQLIDLADRLRGQVDREGTTVVTAQGMRVHPGLVELRQTRQELRRTLSALDLSDAEEGITSAASERDELRARRAQRVRETREGGAGGA